MIMEFKENKIIERMRRRRARKGKRERREKRMEKTERWFSEWMRENQGREINTGSIIGRIKKEEEEVMEIRAGEFGNKRVNEGVGDQLVKAIAEYSKCWGCFKLAHKEVLVILGLHGLEVWKNQML